METVVEEELDLTEVPEQRRQTASARALEVDPTLTQALGYRHPYLRSMLVGDRHLGQVDAPQSAVSCAFERFEHDAAAQSVGDACLHYVRRAQMTNKAPQSASEARVGVVPLPVVVPA